MSGGYTSYGVYMSQGVSDWGVYVLGVSVRGVRAQRGYVLEPYSVRMVQFISISVCVELTKIAITVKHGFGGYIHMCNP